MNNVKVNIEHQVIITNKNINKGYYDSNKIIVGRENTGEIRTYINIDLKQIETYSIKHIKKINIFLYLDQLDLKEQSDYFMLSIGTVFNDINKDEINWNHSPQFHQENLMFKISEKDKKKYIKLDVTNIYIKYLSKGIIPVGFMLLCFNANALISFSLSDTTIGFIEVCYDDNEINNVEEKKEDTVFLEKCCGQFYSINESIIKDGDIFTVILQKSINTRGINNKRKYIKFSREGLYKVEYSINCITNRISTMMLVIDDKIVEQSVFQVGNNEGVTAGNCIIKIENKNSVLKLALCGEDIMVLDIGIGANLTILEI